MSDILHWLSMGLWGSLVALLVGVVSYTVGRYHAADRCIEIIRTCEPGEAPEAIRQEFELWADEPRDYFCDM